MQTAGGSPGRQAPRRESRQQTETDHLVVRGHAGPSSAVLSVHICHGVLRPGPLLVYRLDNAGPDAWRLRSRLVSLALTRHPVSLLLQTGRLLVAVAVQPPGKRHKSAGKRPKLGGESLEKLHTQREKQLLFLFRGHFGIGPIQRQSSWR